MIIDNGFVENFSYAAANRGHVEQLNCAVHIVCTHDHVYIRRLLAHKIFVFLRQAAGDNNLTLASKGLAGFFPRLQPAKCSVQLLVGVFANATGV